MLRTAPSGSHCNTLHHTATQCNIHGKLLSNRIRGMPITAPSGSHCNTLQHTATHCITLHYTRQAVVQLISRYADNRIWFTLQHNATRCNILQHTRKSIIQQISRYADNRTLRFTLQHTTTHCNIHGKILSN